MAMTQISSAANMIAVQVMQAQPATAPDKLITLAADPPLQILPIDGITHVFLQLEPQRRKRLFQPQAARMFATAQIIMQGRPREITNRHFVTPAKMFQGVS
jgi:hypothetical protein